MKKNVTIYSISLAILIAIGSQEVAAQGVPFSPFLPQDTINVPARFPVKGNIGDSAAANAAMRDMTAQSQAVPKENSQIFRVQLITSNQFSEASFARKVAEEIFAVPVEVAYDAPYYKLRVGEFASREEAERYLPKAQSAGYTNPVVVAAITGIQKAAPAYDITTDSTAADSSKGKQ